MQSPVSDISFVVPGLVPGIHVFTMFQPTKDVDGRDEARP